MCIRDRNCPGHYSRVGCEKGGRQGQVTLNPPQYALRVDDKGDVYADGDELLSQRGLRYSAHRPRGRPFPDSKLLLSVRPLLADTVVKVENRTAPKISQMLIFGRLPRWDAP